jgi:hypothetical protein
MTSYELGKDIQEIKARLTASHDANSTDTADRHSSRGVSIEDLATRIEAIEDALRINCRRSGGGQPYHGDLGIVSTPPTEDQLENCVGKHISEFCGNGYTSNATNHCAHFVGHTILINVGTDCRDLVVGPAFGASLRVHEIFANCTQVGRWADLPTVLTWGLIFITNPANVDLATKTMQNVPNKHVGIFFGAQRKVYQYKNAAMQVVRQTPTEFGQHYPAPDNGLFYGTI